MRKKKNSRDFFSLIQHEGVFSCDHTSRKLCHPSENTRGISRRAFKKKNQTGPNTHVILPLIHTVKSCRRNTKSRFPINFAFKPTSRFPLLPPSLPPPRGAQSLLLGCNQSPFCPRCNLITPVSRPANIREEGSDLARREAHSRRAR